MTETPDSQPNILHPEVPRSHKKKIIILSILVGFFAVLFGVGMAYGHSFEGRVLPGTHIGSFNVGGMTEDELTAFIENMEDKLLSQGIPVTFNTPTTTGNFILYTQSIGEDSVVELIEVDAPTVARELVSRGRTGNIVLDSFGAISAAITRSSVEVRLAALHNDKISAEIDRNIASHINPMINAGVRIFSVSPLEYQITSSSRGSAFDYEHISDQIAESWSHLEQPVIHIDAVDTEPHITETDVEGIIDTLPRMFVGGAVTLEYFNSSTKRMYDWKLSLTSISRMLEVEKNDSGELMFTLSPSSTYAYLRDTVAPDVDVAPQNAKFSVGDDNKVTEFQGSHPGVTVDVEKTYQDLKAMFVARFTSVTSTNTVVVATKEVEPEIKTSDVNQLGITEVLGVGQSIFKGSPGNRYKNIRHAAFDKLNGLIIKPGENFSLLEALKPFTLSGGYLPELAIKGDRLVPEIGGGLCQIGTTMFRAAMNAGLEITERRNHSLMISYYNDLTNGLPGTDATIYDPGTDFRFLNDTGHHILITSELNDKTGDLFFTLWGTSDGRKGYYIPPTVSRRMPAGPTKFIETTELPPGKKECQHAYPGAVASFTYVRELPTGEKKEIVFDSYYRPLPETCLVGKALPVEETPTDGEIQPEDVLSDVQDGENSPLLPSDEESVPLEG